MESDMRLPGGKKGEIPSRGLENCGVSDEACHGKCQTCDGDGKPSCAGVNGISSLTESVTEEEARGSVARSGYVESADHDGYVHGKNGSCMAGDDLPQDSESEHAWDTLEDLFSSNDEEEDGSDWEPKPQFIVNRWFCLNCTMPNMDDITYCLNCLELKGSYVAGYDAFKAQIAQAAFISADIELPLASTAIGFDERMLLHSEIETKPNPHPERPDRLRAIAASLAAAGIFPSKCALVPPREITKEELIMVHTPDHIESVEQTKNMLYSYFTADTYANGHTACAAKLAAGLCADLATLIISGRVRNGFAMVRPPGHHAGVKQAMGFCLHNNAAVAALAAQRAGAAKKVLIVDWDVHHGNGTQEIFEGNKSVSCLHLSRYREVVERRVFTVTGNRPDEETIDDLIETGKSEQIFKDAIQQQGRGQILDTVAEIQERHDAVRDLERKLLELQQIFLDMAVLVEAQGDMINHIETHVSNATNHIQQGVSALQNAKKLQRNSRKWMCYAIIILLVIVVIIVVAVIQPWKKSN